MNQHRLKIFLQAQISVTADIKLLTKRHQGGTIQKFVSEVLKIRPNKVALAISSMRVDANG